MAECPQFQLMPQVVPIYQPPPPQPNAFPIPGQPVYPLPPAHFGYPPIAWSPIPHYPPQPRFRQADENEDGEFSNAPQPAHESNDTQNKIPWQPVQSRGVSNKVRRFCRSLFMIGTTN